MSLIPRFAFLDWGKTIQNYNKFCTKCEKSWYRGLVSVPFHEELAIEKEWKLLRLQKCYS